MAAQSSVQVLGIDDIALSYATAENPRLLLTADAQGIVDIPADLPADDSLHISYIGYKGKTYLIEQLRVSTAIRLLPATSKAITIVGRTDRSADRMIGEIDIISRENIQLAQSQTTVEALESHSNVYVQRSQMGGGSPVLRGFEANRVLLVSDGIRMNNAIYRSGHLQNAITVDPHLLDQVEVIYGPGALLYGSDALGGVIHFRSIEPTLRLRADAKKVTGSAYARYASANSEQTGHLHLQYGGKRWAALSSVTYSDFGDQWSGKYHRYSEADATDYGLRLLYQDRSLASDASDIVKENDHPRLQRGTAYSQVNFNQKLKLQLTDKHYLLAQAQYTTSSNVPRYDQLQEVRDGALRWRQWDYGPQKRLAVSMRSVNQHSTRLYDQLTTQLQGQTVEESRITQRLSSNFEDEQIEAVDIIGINVDAHKQVSQRLLLSYGVEAVANRLSSTASSATAQGVFRPTLTRYADGDATMCNAGAYLLGEMTWGNHTIHAGSRYSYQRLRVSYADSIILWPAAYYDGVTNNTRAVTGSIAHRYTQGAWTINTSVGTAFRAPNIDDQAKIRVKNNEVTIPNLALRPERSFTGEVGLGYQQDEQVNIGVTAFYTRLNDAIVQDGATLPDGSSTLVQDGEVLTTVANVNAATADIVGGSFTVRYRPIMSLQTEASLSYVRGRQQLNGETSPLSHIPPLYGRASLIYQANGWTSRVTMRFNGSKPLDQYGGSPDNIELATPVGSPAWYVIDLSAQRQIGSHWQVEVGIDNLLNRFYRPFASGVNGPGFGVVAGLRYSF